jgi:uncharacterized protein YegP (UPF0339 family)
MQNLPNEPSDDDVREAVEEMAKAEPNPLRFAVKQNKRTKQWRWKLLSENNKSIAVSGESYHNRQNCLDMVDLIKRAAAMAEVREVEG